MGSCGDKEKESSSFAKESSGNKANTYADSKFDKKHESTGTSKFDKSHPNKSEEKNIIGL